MSDANSALGRKTWSVHRQDDNGNRFVVASGLTEDDARKLAEEYKRRGHKQLYWVSSDGQSDFQAAAERILAKNAELYRRLA